MQFIDTLCKKIKYSGKIIS